MEPGRAESVVTVLGQPLSHGREDEKTAVQAIAQQAVAPPRRSGYPLPPTLFHWIAHGGNHGRSPR